METVYQILGLLGAGLIVWLLYRNVQARPDVFSKENFGKSAYTMGMLALGLIAFVFLLVWVSR